VAIDTRKKRLSMLNFAAGGNALLPDPQGDSDQGARLTLLGLYRLGVAALRRALAKGPKGHKEKQPFTVPMLDFEKVRLDRLAATEAAERRMLTQRIGVEQANLRTIVASMASAGDLRQQHLRMQIAQIEARIKDLQMHLGKLKGGLRQ